MCGRFTLTLPLDELVDYFNLINASEIDYKPSYNIAPSQNVFAIVSDGTNNKGGFLKWGLVPSWAKAPSIGHKMINARSETLEQKASFRKLLTWRRCVIVGDGFYEWKRDSEGQKQPYRITLKNNKPIAFAGLWDRWVMNDELLTTTTIITTTPNNLMADIHNRMPVILTEQATKLWLNRDIQNITKLKSLLTPYDSNDMKAYEVATLVNSPRNNQVECIAPLA